LLGFCFGAGIDPQQHQRLGSQIQITCATKHAMISGVKSRGWQEAFAASIFRNIRSTKPALTIAYLFGELFPATERWAFFDCDADRPDTGRTTSDSRRPRRHALSIGVLTSIAAVGAVIIGATEEAG
jgi:hypothetical protein